MHRFKLRYNTKIMDEIKINKVQIRNLQIEDYDQLAQSFTRVYSDGSDVFWTHKQIEKLIRIFPEGQIVTVVDEKIVGCALSIIVNYDDVKNDHTYAQVTGKETFNTHNPKGNILYGIEVFIHPQYRGLRLARRMYEYRKEICETLNLKAIMFDFGGEIQKMIFCIFSDFLVSTNRIEIPHLKVYHDKLNLMSINYHNLYANKHKDRLFDKEYQ